MTLRGRLLVRRIVCWTLVVLWMGLIFWFSAQNSETSASLSGGVIKRVAAVLTPDFARRSEPQQAALVAQWQFFVRKLAHFSEYAVLGMLLIAAFSAHIRGIWRQALPAALISLLYAAGDEWHQSFVPGRGPGLRDVAIDFTGALAGIVLAYAISAFFRRRKRRKTKQ